MQAVHYIEDIEQALALLKPQRLEIIQRLDEPRSCPQLAAEFDSTAQKIYYHIKELEKAGLIDKVNEQRVRGTVESFYQARARSYWLAPRLIGAIGGTEMSRDQISLRVLLNLAEEVHEDIGRLGQRAESGTEVPSLSLSAHIHLPDVKRRSEFLEEVSRLFEALATKYGGEIEGLELQPEAGGGFRLVLMTYPMPSTEDQSRSG